MKGLCPARETCSCGQRASAPADLEGSWLEVTCVCDRRLELERLEDRWVVRGDLVPERSVPIGGFSRELRLLPDTERFRFEARDRIGRRIPVHLVFSPSRRVAEVKHGDVKPMKLSNVTNPTEARRRWAAARTLVATASPLADGP